MPVLDKIKIRFKALYREYEARKLAKLSPTEQAEILAFDTLLKGHVGTGILVFIALWATGMALFRWSTESEVSWFEAAVLSLMMIGAIGMGLLSAWFGHARFTPSIKLFFSTLSLAIAGGVVGGTIGRFAKHGFNGFAGLESVESFSGSELSRAYLPVLMGGLIAGLIYFALLMMIVQFRRSQLQRRIEELAETAQQERLARQLTDARLKLLQAQVEPHFLFNTLASVQQLAEARAPDAATLVSQLITFLRSGLSGLREESSTLQREFQMVDAYLAIMKTRMDSRLVYRLELPADLASQPVPPAMLISLVENAIKHGLEPYPPGGEIVITASAPSGQLRVVVADNGRGIEARVAVNPMKADSHEGGGLGLANIRERLAALYGASASLETINHKLHGFTSILHLPGSALVAVPETVSGKSGK